MIFRTAALFLLALAGVALPAADAVDPRGPISNSAMTVKVGAEGVEAPGYAFTDHCQKPDAWQGQWIRLAPGQPDPAVACLRKEVVLADAPRQVDAWLSGDTRYRLWINGRLVARGPVDMGRDYAGGSTNRWFYDARDLTQFFRKGVNVIAAEVFHEWPVGFTVSRGHGGLLFEAAVTLADGSTQVLRSDPTWRGQSAAWYPKSTAYDPAKEPAGWRLPGFDDAAWPACALAGDHWTPLVASEIPPLMEGAYPVLRIDQLSGGVTARADGGVAVSGDGSFRVVFDRVLSAYPALTITGGRGAVATIKAEYGFEVALGDGEQRIEFPYMTEIAPAYTVTLAKVAAPFTISGCGATFTAQPVAYRGSFACSDERLTEVWKVARWAVEICQQTHHLDSPNHQEPISDPGDYLIEAMVGHYAFAQPWLARQDLRKFAWLLQDEHYSNFHTSYSLGWLQMLMDYYDYTGDRALVEELAPTVHALLDTYAGWRGPNGIISQAPNYMFMDWVTIGGFTCHHPPAVIGQGYLTAYYYHGLEQGARIAQLLGDGERQKRYGDLRAQLAVAFQRELWVPGKGLYRDGKPFQTTVKPGQWLPADTDIETFSPHVNLLAVLYDLAPKAEQAAIVERVLAVKPLNTQPWFMHWVFQAIDHAGLFDRHGTEQLRRWHIVRETRSFHEMWHEGDLSHGWCSTPVVQLSGRVLGVTPAEPGFRRVAVHPELCDLVWAKGAVPTPHGLVEVAWRLANGGLELDVTVPAGTTAEVVVPTGRFRDAAVKADGAAVSGADPTVHVLAGAHRFLVTGTLIAPPAALQPVAGGGAAEGTTSEPDGFEDQVVNNDLVHAGAACRLASSEDHCSHPGGANDTSALFNGTTHNGDGEADSSDDGRTFRGYGAGDFLILHLDAARSPSGYDISRMLSFAGHPDARAGQAYNLSFAFAKDPTRFVPFATAAQACAGGGSLVRFAGQGGGVLDNHAGCRASGVVAVRYDFAACPVGFSCYREFCVVGAPTK